ncbi:unnamed protein product [Candidula unifasciata]|uniref:Uncharacterized protein n=1 Tax=Candidula unifasciata TaxID=100452 RepID=A0A8S3Z3G1_9EUPU|nr:unnamed protein product [Candidula unifasciata]
MYKLVALSVLLTAPLVSMTIPPKQCVIDFCELILLQSKNVATFCNEAPTTYDKDGGGDEAILIYMCCLGMFGDVTHDYMPYLADDFVTYIFKLISETLLRSIAKFIMACKSEARKLSTSDFQSWLANNTSCPAI